jgi:transcriptional regulator with XRE-family HTH domain
MGRKRTTDDTRRYAQQLAERLRITRRLVEPKQVEAARAVGVTQNVWYRFERGLREADPFILALFCIQYEIDANWILLGDPEHLRFAVLQALFRVPEAQKYLRGLPEPDASPPSPQNTHSSATDRARTKLLDH